MKQPFSWNSLQVSAQEVSVNLALLGEFLEKTHEQRQWLVQVERQLSEPEIRFVGYQIALADLEIELQNMKPSRAALRISIQAAGKLLRLLSETIDILATTEAEAN